MKKDDSRLPEKVHIRFEDGDSSAMDVKSKAPEKYSSEIQGHGVKRSRDGSPKESSPKLTPSPSPKRTVLHQTNIRAVELTRVKATIGAKQPEGPKKTKDEKLNKSENGASSEKQNSSQKANGTVTLKTFYGNDVSSTNGSKPDNLLSSISNTHLKSERSRPSTPYNSGTNRLAKVDTSNSSPHKVFVSSVQSSPSRHSPVLQKVNRDQLHRQKLQMDRFRVKLPIWNHRADIRWGLRKSNILLLVGETGSGKSTQVPQFLLNEPWCKRNVVKIQDENGHFRDVPVGGKIAITEPRRVAAVSLAHRVAKETGSYIGEYRLSTDKDQVSYSVRFDSFMPQNARIKYLTEGMLLQELLRDPYLRDYSAIIIDEIHERKVDVDLVAGFVKNILSGDDKGRGGIPLKVVIMSATVNMDGIKTFFTPHSAEGSGHLGRTPNGLDQQESPQNSTKTDSSVKILDESLKKRNEDTRRQSDASFSSWDGITSEEDTDKNEPSSNNSSPFTDNPYGVRPPYEFPTGPIDVAVHHIMGNQYDVQVLYTRTPVEDYVQATLKTIFQIHTTEPLPGDILAFLIGQEEIEQLRELVLQFAEKFSKDIPKIDVLPLYGQLSMEDQQRAFLGPRRPRTRKVVLATNIAETSVTVPGVRYVIDCGKSKVKKYRSNLGLSSLLPTPISQSSAIQRKGRAGREARGKCFRLYTENEYLQLRKSDDPEILSSNVAEAIFKMKTRGIHNVLTFPLMDRPDMHAMQNALFDLHTIGVLADDGSLTEAGKRMAKFPLSTPYSRVLIAAAEPENDCLIEAIDAISCLHAEEEIFYQPKTEEKREEVEEARRDLLRREGDIITYMTTIQKYARESDRSQWCQDRMINSHNIKRAFEVRKQLRQACYKEGMLPEKAPKDVDPFESITPERGEVLLKCFLKGFAMKTAVLHPNGSYETTQGKNVVAIHPSSILHGQKKEAIMFLEHVFTQKNYAKKVSVIQMNWIAEALEV